MVRLVGMGQRQGWVVCGHLGGRPLLVRFAGKTVTDVLKPDNLPFRIPMAPRVRWVWSLNMRIAEPIDGLVDHHPSDIGSFVA